MFPMIATVILLLCISLLRGTANNLKDFGVITIATDEANDGFNRFMMSAKFYDLEVKVLGVSENINEDKEVQLIKDALEEYRDNDDVIVMFIYSSKDTLITAGKDTILKSFKTFKSRVVFSLEDVCQLDSKHVKRDRKSSLDRNRCINSGGFIGYSSDIYNIISSSEIKDKTNKQLFPTNIYLDAKLRENMSVRIDKRRRIFQNVKGALDVLMLKSRGNDSFLYNNQTGTIPIIVYGNHNVKSQFNGLANYLAGHWTPRGGCQICQENTFSLRDYQIDDFPKVLLAIFMEHPTAFASDFLDKIESLNYPKSKIDLFIHYADRYHEREFRHFVGKQVAGYNSVKVLGPDQELSSGEARNKALQWCIFKGTQYYMNIDGDVQIENKNLIQMLIEKNRTVIAPMFAGHWKTWSNFWGGLTSKGHFKESGDYKKILLSKKIGQWNVPYVSYIYLIHSTKVPHLKGGYINGNLDPDIAICKRMRKKGIFMVLDNERYYGHLVNSDDFDTSHLHNDLYTILDNQYTWEQKYLHPLYKEKLKPDVEVNQPCPEVFWCPIVTEVFCKQLIEEMEHYGQWFNGKHKDPRVEGGYESVPAVDIHMSQIDMEDQWFFILENYIAPVVAKIFDEYQTEVRADISTVIKYQPGGQDHLKPHYDTSTYTVNVALNTPQVDFIGGGVNFTRYNCSFTDSRPGWMLLHPGRLTHRHEGLKVTWGTRYIIVCFVDP